MSCRTIKSPITGKEVISKTWTQIRDHVESDEEADEMYEHLLSPHFIQAYGNWIEGPKYFEKQSMLNDIGEPKFELLEDWLSDDLFQKEGSKDVVKKADRKSYLKFKEWARRVGLQKVDRIESNGKVFVGEGIAKLAEGLYYVAKGSEETAEPEEIMHFAVDAMEANNPELFSQLLNKIGSDPIYRPVFEEYSKDSKYRTKDNKPDVRKIKIEAITKRLVNTIIEKEQKTWWADIFDRIKSWFLGLTTEFNPFEVAAERIIKGETFGAETIRMKDLADRILKKNPHGMIGDFFRTAYNTGDFKGAVSFFYDQLKESNDRTMEINKSSIKNVIDGYFQGDVSLAEDIVLAMEDKGLEHKPVQQNLYNDIKTNKGVVITKEINPDEKEEDGTPKQMYKVNGKWVKRRVTDIVKALYRRVFGDGDITKSQYQKAVDEIKRNYGVEGHADMEHAFHSLVDENGDIRVNPLDDSSYTPATSTDIYNILKKNLSERMLSFPAGTKFLAETIVYDDKRDLGGTIDFLAIEPDGQVSILDWKFMDLNTDQFNEVPFYKRRAFRIQISEYRRILSEKYGVPLSKFKLTEAIPIKAEYNYVEGADGKKYPVLTGIQIGNVNTKVENADYLLPVALESQSTGDKDLDKLLRKLMGLRSVIEDRPSKTFDDKFNKAEQLNILEKAIRHIQIKQSIIPFVEQADVFNKDVQNIIDTFYNALKDKDFSTIENKELSEYGIKLNRSFDEINIYTNLDNEVSSLFKGTLSPEDQKLYDKIRDIVSNARRLSANLKNTAFEFGSKLADAKKVDALLDAEVAVSSLKKLFDETSKLPTAVLKTFYEYRREAQNNMDLSTAADSEDLVKIQQEYEKLAKSKGWNNKNYFDILKKKTKNELIDQYQKDFYVQARKATKEKSYDWIKANIDTEAYKNALKEDLQRKIDLINARPWTDERKNEAITREKLKYTILKKDGYGWFSHRRILIKFPLQKWESDEWLELHKAENKAALDAYNWIIKINQKADDTGYIPEGSAARTFLPFVPKSLMEQIVLGGERGVGTSMAENFIRSITVDEDTIGYGAIDPVTGQLLNRIPKYLTGNFENRELSNNLFKNLNLYNEFVNKYKYLSEMEGIALALGRVERNKESILTSSSGNPVFNKEKNEFEIIESNDKNADLYDRQIATLIYGQKYVNSEKFDQMLGKVDGFTKGVNKLVGFKLLPENISDRQISMNKAIDQVNSFFQLKTLGLSILPALSNYIGGNLQLQINAGRLFTKADILKSEAEIMAVQTLGEKGKKIIGALKYFVPFTRDVNKDVSRKLSLTPLTETGIQDFLMLFMRAGDKVIEGTIFNTLLRNAVLIDGKIHNAREYIRSSNEYRDRYTDGKLHEKEAEFEKKVEDLIKEYSLMDKIEIKGDQIEIPGISRLSEETFKIRNAAKALSKRVIGNMSPEEVRGVSQNIISNSMMIFKNWIPSLLDQRIGKMQYNNDVEAWEWGRMRTVARFLALDGIKGLNNMRKAVFGLKGGIESLSEMYEYKRKSYYESTGKELNISREEFYDLVRGNIRQQAKDLLFTLTLLSLFFAAKAVPPDDDEDAIVKSRHKFIVRMLDKISDEVSFYYSPNAIQQILNGQLFPSLSIFTDAATLLNHFMREMYGIFFDDNLQEKNYVIKYVMKSFPITSQLASYMPLYAPDAAKDLGIQMSTQARLR